MEDIDRHTFDLISGAGMESILMPRKQFVKEHKNLLKVLKSGDPKLLKKEYDDQKKELEGKGIAEDKRYINSKTPYTLAKEMTSKMLKDYHADPAVPPSMKDKLSAAMEMKGGMEGLRLAPCEGEAHTGETTLTRAELDEMKEILTDDDVTPGQVGAAIRTLRPTLSSELDKNLLTVAEGALGGRGTQREKMGHAINYLITLIDRVFPARVGGWKGSQQAGFVRRMMAEAKKKHGGDPYGPNPRIPSYKNPTRPLHPESSMKAKVPFDFNKIKQEQDGGENDDENYGPSPFLLRHFGRGYTGGSTVYDVDTDPQSISIVKDRPFSTRDYIVYKNFAHLLDAFQKSAPVTRQKQAAVPMESTLRFLLEEMKPGRAGITKKQDEDHYKYSKNKFYKARAALEGMWEGTGLRKAVEDAAKASGFVRRDGKGDVGAFMPTLIAATEGGTEDTLLGKPLGDFLFKVGAGMTGGLTEEELRLRDLAKKKAAREAKNLARAEPPARKAKEVEVDRRAEEERQRADAEARRVEAEARRRADTERQREAERQRQREVEAAKKAERDAAREAERLREEAERPAKEAERERQHRANLPLLGFKWAPTPPKMPDDIQWDMPVPKEIVPWAQAGFSLYDLWQSRRGYGEREVEYLQEVFQSIIDNLEEQGWEVGTIPSASVNWVGRDAHLSTIDKYWFPRQSKPDQDKYMAERETQADREVVRRRAYWDGKGEDLDVLFPPGKEFAISFTPEYWAEGDIRREREGVPRLGTSVIFKKNGDRWDDTFRYGDALPGMLYKQYGFRLYADLVPRASSWQKLIDDGKYRDPYEGAKGFDMRQLFGRK